MSSHLRVVRDELPKPRRRKGLRAPPVLSLEQDRAAKVALRGLAVKRYGSLAAMSRALGYYPHTLANVLCKRGRVTPEILLRAALACSVPVEGMITPGPREVTS